MGTIVTVPEGCQALPIEGACLFSLQVIDAEGGAVMHMLRPSFPLRPNATETASPYLHIGEVYFSEVKPYAIKAWKRHSLQTQFFTVPVGQMKFVLYDDRSESQTRGTLHELCLGRPDTYALLRIPVGIWYGFTALNAAPALICNCADLPHDPTEGERLPLDSPYIPYHWTKG